MKLAIVWCGCARGRSGGDAHVRLTAWRRAAAAPEQCSSIRSDDASPTWNDTLLTGLDGGALLQAPLSFDYEDSDLDSSDLICSGGRTLTAGELHAGGFRFDCGNGAYARFSLRNSDRGAPAR